MRVTLPDDCVLECLKHFMGCIHTDFVAFVRARNIACAVNGNWKAIVEAVGSFWARIVLTQQVSVGSLIHWLSRARKGQLVVHIVFRDLRKYYRHGNISSRICAYAARVVPLLVATTDYWSGLTMDVEDPACATMVLGALRNSRASFLRAMEIDCRLSRSLQILDADGTSSNIPTLSLFRGGVDLRRLSLKIGPLYLQSIVGFGQLTCLEIAEGQNTGSRYRLDELLAVLRDAARLRNLTLAMENVVLGLDAGIGQGTIFLPALEHLDVQFRSVAMGILISLFDAPSLTSATVTVNPDTLVGFATCLSRRQNIFATVSTLALRMSSDAEFGPLNVARRIFESFTSVVHLDLVGSRSSLFCDLVDTTVAEEGVDFPSGILLPGLKHLSLEVDALGSVRAFLDVRMRVARCSLHRLHVQFPGPEQDIILSDFADWNYILLNVITFPVFRLAPPTIESFAVMESDSDMADAMAAGEVEEQLARDGEGIL